MTDDEATIAKIMATTGIDRAGAVQAVIDGHRLAEQIIEAAEQAEEPAPRKKRKKPASPSAMTLKACAKRGWIAGVVERFVRFPPPGHKVDLFGVIDIVAVTPRETLHGYVNADGSRQYRNGETIGIQATTNTGGHHAKHRTKILAEPRARAWVEAGNRLELWTWAKQGAVGKAKRWTLRVERFEVRDGKLVGIEEES